jgi:hypothetical protein
MDGPLMCGVYNDMSIEGAKGREFKLSSSCKTVAKLHLIFLGCSMVLRSKTLEHPGF